MAKQIEISRGKWPALSDRPLERFLEFKNPIA
jgi:hypothetical protein